MVRGCLRYRSGSAPRAVEHEGGTVTFRDVLDAWSRPVTPGVPAARTPVRSANHEQSFGSRSFSNRCLPRTHARVTFARTARSTSPAGPPGPVSYTHLRA